MTLIILFEKNILKGIFIDFLTLKSRAFNYMIINSIVRINERES